MPKKGSQRPGTEPAHSQQPAALPAQGAYLVTLGPQEQALFDEILAAYMAELEAPTPSERLAVIRLALYEMRCRLDAIAGAPVDALDVGSRLLQREAKALQMTRESQAGGKSLGKTAAEVIQALLERARDRQRLGDGVPTGRLIEARPASEPRLRDLPQDDSDDSQPTIPEPSKNVAEDVPAAPAGRPSGKGKPPVDVVEDDLCDMF